MILLKNKMQRSPEGDESGGGNASQEEEVFLDDNENGEGVIGDLHNDAVDEFGNKVSPTEDKTSFTKEKTDPDDEDDSDDKEDVDDEFVLDENEESDKDEKDEEEDKDKKEVTAENESEEEDDFSWDKAAEELGIKGDQPIEDFDTLKSSFEKKINDVSQSAYKKGKSEGNVIDLVAEFGADGAYAINFFRAGGKPEELINPTSPYAEFISLTPDKFMEAYYTEKLEGKGYTDEQIQEKVDKRIALLKETESFEFEYGDLLDNVKRAHVAHVDSQVQKRISEAKQLKDNFISLSAESEEKLMAAIDKTEVYEGKKVPKEIREKIKQQWKSNYYRERFKNDPEFVAKMIFDFQLSKQAIKAAAKSGKETAEREKDAKLVKKLHNLPDRKGAPGRTNARSTQPDDDSFDSWKGIDKQPMTIHRE